MKYILVFFIFALLSNTASTSERISLVAKRNFHVGPETMSVVLEGNKITASSNTNFITNEFPLRFGVFEMNPSLELKKKILNLTQIKNNKSGKIAETPHTVKVYVNGNEIQIGSSLYGKVIAAINETLRNKDLKLKDGVIFNSLEEANEIECDKTLDGICIFKYGNLYR